MSVVEVGVSESDGLWQTRGSKGTPSVSFIFVKNIPHGEHCELTMNSYGHVIWLLRVRRGTCNDHMTES